MTEKATAIIPWIQLAVTVLVLVIGATLYLTGTSREEATQASALVASKVSDKLSDLKDDVGEIKDTVSGLDTQMRELREWRVETSLLVARNAKLSESCLDRLREALKAFGSTMRVPPD